MTATRNVKWVDWTDKEMLSDPNQREMLPEKQSIRFQN